jgi:hypothetical protein
VTSAETRKWIRIGLAGPGSAIVALVVMGGMALWLPGGAAGIDNLVMPLILVPIVWVALFFHACLDRRLVRVAIVAGGLLAVHGSLIALKLLETPASTTGAHR